MRILYVGSLVAGGTCGQRMVALSDLGHTVVPLDTTPPWVTRGLWPYLAAAGRRVGRDFDLARVNSRLRAYACHMPCDVLWIDKGLSVTRRTLAFFAARQPTCAVVGYSPDDMMNPGNQTNAFISHLGCYDVFFTTKSYGVRELESLGARRVVFVPNAFDPRTHRPLVLSSLERDRLGGPVGFIGSWEGQRAESLTRLAQRGIPTRVWGSGWSTHDLPENVRVERKSLWADDYAKAICAFDINLCFLRKANRDLQTTRSVEIPACGAFMLAERTREHLALFEEGVEAEYFSDDDELATKVTYYLQNPEQRNAIAAAGLQRCERSGYSNHARLAAMLSAVEEITAAHGKKEKPD